MKLEDLQKEYDLLQKKHGAKELNAIYNGGCDKNPEICFIFMNPTGRNVASKKEWKGIRAPWIGTKNIWKLFNGIGLLENELYLEILNKKPNDWDEEFARKIYDDVAKNKYFINNLGKCTQIDARSLPNSIYLEYLDLLKKEIDILKPKIIIALGNQVSSIILNEKISVSKCRKQYYNFELNDNIYKVYPVFYPIGNGIFNIDKAIDDIKYIMKDNDIKNE